MKVYVYGEPIDMRLGFERLSYFVREEMGCSSVRIVTD